ncbi:PaaI family thioesterase [Microlunatus speluncae]|uniref:PaaI family thioesterase n=1 Tax=Microlunatus speluncae TaxID=2594267 RepID=UPI0012664CCD|nr:PaaI family thioesterase [Microlunatus speluncae]
MTERPDLTQRTGPFWDGVNGRLPIPQAALTLGFEFLDADPDQGTIELAFTASDAFTNPAGNVLGAFVAAMLYDTLGPALLATLEPDRFQETLDQTTHFLRPTRPGRLLGHGRVLRRAGDIAHLEATLTELDGTLIATATATARVIPLTDARTAV